ncbi:MAG: sigma-54 dependent transcriptional regulator [bacterium]
MTAPQKNAPSSNFLTWDHPPKVHIVEHDSSSRAMIESFLRQQGLTIQSFGDGEALLEAAAHGAPDIVLLNIHLPGIGGIETVTRFKKRHPDSFVIFLSDEDSADTCAQAMRLGAYDIILKPFQKTCLTTAIRNALQKRDLIRELKKLKSELHVRYDFTSIIGSTPAITRMKATLKRLAASDVPVLLHGARGSGKELAARTLHYNSRFAEGPFLCVNCSVLRNDLLESEIFSPLRGNSVNHGNSIQKKWMRAKGGTLFLDDITDMELPLLNKLLNHLKSCGNFQAGKEDMPIDFRIICGTREDIGEGGTNLEEYSQFFKLLAPFQVKIPSLRNRTDDIPLLIKHFLNKAAQEGSRAMPNIAPEAMRILNTYPWPGNVRELRNVINQTFLLSDSDRIGPEDLPLSICESGKASSTDLQERNGADFNGTHKNGWGPNEAGSDHHLLESNFMNGNAEERTVSDTRPGKKEKKEKAPFLTLKESETGLIQQALEYTNWNMKRTGSLLGISRPALYRRIEKLKIIRKNPPSPSPDKDNPSFPEEPEDRPNLKSGAMAGTLSFQAGWASP